jgi:hypothetical protein
MENQLIIHKIRIKLNLSVNEYTILDFIKNWHEKNNSIIKYEDFNKYLGFSIEEVNILYQSLKLKELLFKDIDSKVKTTNLWNIHFDTNKHYEELWKLHNVGNKQKGKQAFEKAITVDAFDNIKKGLVSYISFLKETEQFPVHLSSFLNYKNKDWQTERDLAVYKKKQVTEPIINTGPKSAFG